METRYRDKGGNHPNEVIVHVSGVTQGGGTGCHDGRHLHTQSDIAATYSIVSRRIQRHDYTYSTCTVHVHQIHDQILYMYMQRKARQCKA